MTVKIWFQEIRAPFLTLPLICTLLSLSVAGLNGFFNPVYSFLTLFGVILLHVSVNVLNDYFDYKSGLDLSTKPTPFSGGSGILPKGDLNPTHVFGLGLTSLIGGLTIGSYFVYIFNFDLVLILLIGVAALSVLTYSSMLASWGLGELIVGLNFGPLLFMGTYYVQSSTLSLEVILLGVIMGIFVSSILLINEFPDHDADLKHGRKNLVVRLGSDTASKLFSLLLMTPYLLIVIGILFSILPIYTIIALITIPKARFAIKHLSANRDKIPELIPAMGTTVQLTMFTGILLIVSYLAINFINLPVPSLF